MERPAPGVHFESEVGLSTAPTSSGLGVFLHLV
jgi:hypothetical protein